MVIARSAAVVTSVLLSVAVLLAAASSVVPAGTAIATVLVIVPVAETRTGAVTVKVALPALNTLSLTTGQYGDYFRHVSPLGLFALAGALIYAIWSPRFRRGALA